MNRMSSTFYTTQLVCIYGAERAAQVESRLQKLVGRVRGRIPDPADPSLSERDSILITYGDQVQEKGKSHLQTLVDFCEAHLKGIVGGVHILPYALR